MNFRISTTASALLAISLLLGGMSFAFAQETPTLSVSLSPDPSTGIAPLSGVDLNAIVAGTATGTINYTFYCNRSDNGTNLVGTAAVSLSSSSTTINANDACSYNTPGTYVGKVIVERGGLFSEARTTITVNPAPVTPTLSVSLSANPVSGVAPLSGVDLTAIVSGTATGTTNYTFYCDRSDNGTNLVGSSSAQFANTSATTQMAVDVCSYASVGTYTGKVVVERAGLFAEARTAISATQQSATTTPTSTPPVMQKGEWKLEIGPAGRALLRGHIDSVTADSLRVRSWGGVWTVRVLSGAEIIPRVSAQLFDLTRFQPGDYVGINGAIVRDQQLTIDARVIGNWTEKREVKLERKENHEFLKRLIKDDRISDSLTGRTYEGTVGTISGSSFTLTARGTVVTVNTTPATRLIDKNYASILFTDIQAGHTVRVFGDVTASSTVLAQVVRDTSIPVSSSIASSGRNKGDDSRGRENNRGRGSDDD